MWAVSRWASSRAILAAATANWLKRPAMRPAAPGIHCLTSKSVTSPTIWHSRGSLEASNRVGVPIPERPARAAAQKRSTPMPIGETIPRPVMTACRFIGLPFFAISASTPPGLR